MMLDRAGNNVIPTSALGVGDSFDGEIVGFTSTTSEDDFSWPDAKRSRDRFASIIDRFKAYPAETLDAAWVTEAPETYAMLNSSASERLIATPVRAIQQRITTQPGAGDIEDHRRW